MTNETKKSPWSDITGSVVSKQPLVETNMVGNLPLPLGDEDVWEHPVGCVRACAPFGLYEQGA